MTWINWDSICMSYETGGLGVRRLIEFNSDLLGKWYLRMLEERNSLWFKV